MMGSSGRAATLGPCASHFLWPEVDEKSPWAQVDLGSGLAGRSADARLCSVVPTAGLQANWNVTQRVRLQLRSHACWKDPH